MHATLDRNFFLQIADSALSNRCRHHKDMPLQSKKFFKSFWELDFKAKRWVLKQLFSFEAVSSSCIVHEDPSCYYLQLCYHATSDSRHCFESFALKSVFRDSCLQMTPPMRIHQNYSHTAFSTSTKCSESSLLNAGDTLLYWSFYVEGKTLKCSWSSAEDPCQYASDQVSSPSKIYYFASHFSMQWHQTYSEVAPAL